MGAVLLSSASTQRGDIACLMRHATGCADSGRQTQRGNKCKMLDDYTGGYQRNQDRVKTGYTSSSGQDASHSISPQKRSKTYFFSAPSGSFPNPLHHVTHSLAPLRKYLLTSSRASAS